MEWRQVAALSEAEPPGTCPWSCLRRADPWVVDVTRAVALAVDWHVPVTEALGRPLLAVDVQALAALKSAQGAAWRSDQEIADREREAKK